MTPTPDRADLAAHRLAAVFELFRRRTDSAVARYTERVTEAMPATPPAGIAPWSLWADWMPYAADAAQRSVLFWDTLRQRGDNWLAHEQAGKPPLLHFDHETVLDARTFETPVNYALLRIVPPDDVQVDPRRRPYVIIDPRAGHGPGIGGFKDDSQVGVALRAGHPVYFVVFFPEPCPGQTLPDVCAAEQVFVRKVRELHPDSPKPAIVGNCQGGWAAMMLAASDPEITGPVVINGAPMSYWGGAWSDGEGDNPMRYAGGLLGGSWLASLASDLGGGVFDGAHLVQNFANLNPANALWEKYYNLYAKVDTEAPRFLEFERWWGGFYLMNREEIDWIVQNLFVGNQVWRQPTGRDGEVFDLRSIRSPIVLFASMGDNITPPQQAFNWVADTYASTDEIKARGQVIVGLLHEDIGHLGIFVSGKVAVKEHAQIVSVLKSIETLPPGLYAMRIDGDEERGWQVSFEERSLEDVAARLNRFGRRDEAAFVAAKEVAEFNQKAYELLLQPLVQAWSNEESARIGRALHPQRVEQWALSGLNPWLAWTAPLAGMVKSQRRSAPADSPLRDAERRGADLVAAALDLARDLRDAASEALFFQAYGVAFPLVHGDRAAPAAAPSPQRARRDRALVEDALAGIESGGYAEALARAACLLARRGEPLPLARVELRAEIAAELAGLLPPLGADQWRELRGRQEVICRHAPDRAVETLPALLPEAADRRRFVTLLDTLLADPRVRAVPATAAQRTMLARIRAMLGVPTQPAATRAASRRKPALAHPSR